VKSVVMTISEVSQIPQVIFGADPSVPPRIRALKSRQRVVSPLVVGIDAVGWCMELAVSEVEITIMLRAVGVR